LTREQKTFLDEAVAALAQDGRVVPVRLALLAEMVKDKPWTPATIRELHGMEGVGVRFLDDTFSSPRSNPNHRYHQRAAQAVLKSLLPETQADIRGRMRSVEELRHASGYRDRPGDFDDLIRILDTELRLITPVDLESSTDDDAPPSPLAHGRYYQLTHDYLVHALRDWLTRKQRETRRGRAELVLAERSGLWSAKPENRYLPSLREWSSIRLLTKGRGWTESQRRMMRRGARVHGVRLLGLIGLLALTASGIVGYNVYSRSRELLVDLARAPVDRKPQVLDQLARYPRWLYLSRLRDLARQPGSDQLAQLGYSLALLPDDPGQLDYLFRRLLDADPTEIEILRDRVLLAVQDASREVLADLRSALEFRDGERTEPDAVQDERAERRARAAASLVRLGHGDEVWHLLEHSMNPRSRSAFIHALNVLRADPAIVARELDRLVKSAGTDRENNGSAGEKNSYLFDPVVSKLRALIEALAGCRAEDRAAMDSRLHGELIANLSDLHRSHADAGVHSAAELALKRWGHPARLAVEAGQTPRAGNPIQRRWYVNRGGQTMVLIDGPVTFDMGSPPSEPGRVDFEILHRRIIPRKFAIASTEVSVEQFQRYEREKRGSRHDDKDKRSPDPDGPMIRVNWFDGAAYFNWLSDKENLPHCYVPNAEGKYAEGMRVDADAVAKGGYRFPTEAEWQYACRAGTVSSRYYGSSIELLGLYEWYIGNSEYRVRRCASLLPNDLGLFDMLGNVMEWCHHRHTDYQPGPRGEIQDTIADEVITADRRDIRSDAFYMAPSIMRSAARMWAPLDEARTDVGLRPARTLP
jgi:formylglycine-generating enzyme required for sulfatase activity